MASVRPFKALRPASGYASSIAALPYDVYNTEEARAVSRGKSDTFLRIDRAEINFTDVDMYDKRVYDMAAKLLGDMVSDGRFIRDDKPYYYIYELTMDGRTQTGIVAVSSVDDYDNNIIKKHENTLAAKEQDRINHIDVCSAQTGPIFLAYRGRHALDEIVNRIKANSEAVYDFVADDGIRHRVFIVDDDGDISRIRDEFAHTDSIYIADGHHRAASAVRVSHMRRQEWGDYSGDEEFNYFLSVLFPDSQLMIMDYNRVLRDMNGHTLEELYQAIERYFVLRKESDSPVRPDKKGSISLYDGSRWRLYDIKSEYQSSDPVMGLDVSLLQELILRPFFGIDDPKSDDRIDFVGGIRGLEELVVRCKADAKVAFAMYPTDISELFAVADAGKLMPPKSTWFEPKLRSGLFIHEIERSR